jgi:hypothetical protein
MTLSGKAKRERLRRNFRPAFWHTGKRFPLKTALDIVLRMSEESESRTSEERAWQYFLQLQPSIADVNAAAELAFRAVDAFDRVLKRRRAQGQ